MTYNWQLKGWPNFSYSTDGLHEMSIAFANASGLVNGLFFGLNEALKQEALLEILIAEAIKTSEIEGEYISREDVMSSIKNNLGIQNTLPVKDKRAADIANLTTDVHQHIHRVLDIDLLLHWHQMLMLHNPQVNAGVWRTGEEPMQVISGTYGKEEVHYEAPPSRRVAAEMDQFVQWYHQCILPVKDDISKALLKTAIAHLYFESIHPFADGNGRVGRALAEFTLSQSLNSPVMLSLSKTIEKGKKQYYEQLKKAQRSLDITEWVNYFAQVIVDAQLDAKVVLQFTLTKNKILRQISCSQLNERQLKAVHRMLANGSAGFEGGMTSRKYIALTQASKATATRDLQYLQEIGVFQQTGAGRAVHYTLIL